ncbi:LLM class flavin-dependent oxidoreductase [Myxococcota bacterium]|nr:LLM class flavin-dependent oxidoreductase [Myxococcota bacterium]
MRVSAAFDPNLGFSWCEPGLALRAARAVRRRVRPQSDLEDQRRLTRQAFAWGYDTVYTPDWRGPDALGLCGDRWNASCGLSEDGLQVGTLVSPIPKYPKPAQLAQQALALSCLTGGRFILGVGAGDLYRPAVREQLGWTHAPLIRLVRDYLQALITELDAGLAPGMKRPRIILGALGPQMLRLAGELTDGAVISFSNEGQADWARARLFEGAERSGRDPSELTLMQSVPVSICDHSDLARRRLALAVLPYLRGPDLPQKGEARVGYRAQVERLGFGDLLDEIDDLTRRSTKTETLLSRIPKRLLDQIGYAGEPEGAPEALSRLCKGLDEAVVRVTAAEERFQSASLVLEALRPGPRWDSILSFPGPSAPAPIRPGLAQAHSPHSPPMR